MRLDDARVAARDIRAAVARMSPAERTAFYHRLRATSPRKTWEPLAGPQYAALYSAADELFYGGAAGGGKTDLLIGCALTQHRRSIIFRREYPQLRGVVERVLEIYPEGQDTFNRSRLELRTRDGRLLELGAVQRIGDERKYQGRPHDLKGFDEITHFAGSQYRFLIGWTRSAAQNQRKRIIAAGNPPIDSDGTWVVKYWAPWLAEDHPRPAEPGELRYFTTIDGDDVELDGPNPVWHKGEQLTPRSRTFIPSRIEDNPYLLRTDYKSVIQAMPEPLRSKLLSGDFRGAQGDNAFQVIPIEWIRAAQERWKLRERPAREIEMTAIGADISRGGQDKTILSPRWGNYFAEQVTMEGSMTINGQLVAQKLTAMAGRGTWLNVDVIGVGAAVYDILNLTESTAENTFGLNGSEGSDEFDRSGRLGFVNKRAEWWWKMREALDPSGGHDLALPPDPELLADLAAPRWKLTPRGIQVESKPDIQTRLHRSPDKGDAAVYALVDHDITVGAILSRNYASFVRPI